ncbi:MAG: alanyl-tRNA editing protein [Armatimonadetes bacterium]|nr:alanyl-tRNA editing protein [Armatimonadota bacterium]
MTERLFHQDAYLREFTARVIAVSPGRGGAPEIVELDRTAFYPTSGGQTHDTGVLAGRPVVDVVEEEGRILHHLGPAVPPAAAITPGREVAGRIDWDRRFDHMQQHTGQHILSQAALREAGAETLAVHLGPARCTVDLKVAIFGPDEAERVEEVAGAVVMENRPVLIHTVDEAEVRRMGLRRPPKKQGMIRVVEVEGFDRSACGGTHVRAAGEIGAIAITGWERYKGATRVEFLCGWRAVRDARRKRRVLAEVGRALSAGDQEVAEAVQRVAAREREAARQVEEIRARLLTMEAELRRRGLDLPAVVAEVTAGRDPEEVRGLATALVRPGGLVALLGGDGGRLVFARSADVALDLAALLRRTVERFGGRGGGRPEFAQGSVPTAAALEEVLAAARRWVEEALTAKEADGA